MKQLPKILASLAIGAVALTGCSTTQEEPTKTESSTSSESPTAESSNELKASSAKFVEEYITTSFTKSDDVRIGLEKLAEELPGKLSPNGLELLKNSEGNPTDLIGKLTAEDRTTILEAYRGIDPLDAMYDYNGVSKEKQVLVSIFSILNTSNLSFVVQSNSGEAPKVTIPEDAVTLEGKDHASVDPSKVKATNSKGENVVFDAVMTEVGNYPLVMVDGEWKIDAKKLGELLEDFDG